MDALRAASDDQVIELLRSIEDKLYETGTLASVTENPEAEVTIAFRNVVIRGKLVVGLAVCVVTDQTFDSSDSHWDPLRQFVVSHYASLQCALPEQTRECLLDCPGPVVFVNGARII